MSGSAVVDARTIFASVFLPDGKHLLAADLAGRPASGT